MRCSNTAPADRWSAGAVCIRHPESAAAGTKQGLNRSCLARSRAHFPPALPGDFVRCYALFTVLMFMDGKMGMDEEEEAAASAMWRAVIRPQYAAARRRHA